MWKKIKEFFRLFFLSKEEKLMLEKEKQKKEELQREAKQIKETFPKDIPNPLK